MKTKKLLLTVAAGATAMSVAALGQQPLENEAKESQKVFEEMEQAEQNDSTLLSDSPYDMLDELEVEATRPVVTSDGAKLTYNLDEDPSTGGKTVLDVMRKVPMLTVDGQDNIRINGRDGYKIYVNGKEEPMLSSNASQILKAMPAEAVAKIEVITEPGAKYDAEGNAGIINLITERKQSKNGYSASLSANFSNAMQGANAYGMMKYGKVSASAHVEFADSHLFTTYDNNHTETEFFNTGITQTSNIRKGQKFSYLGGGLDLSYEPNENNLFTVNFSILNLAGKVHNCVEDFDVTDAAGQQLYSYKRRFEGSLHNFSAKGGGSYQHNFGERSHNLVLSYQYDFGKSPFDIDNKYLETDNFSQPTPFQRQRLVNYQSEHTAQADYTNPFGGETHLLEAGAKAIIRNNNGYSSTFTGDDENALSETDRTNIRQFQDVYAGYASYTANVNPLSIKAGLRYEHTVMGIHDRLGKINDFTNHLNDLVPNAAVTYTFAPACNLRLAYQMRISRPTIQQVNPGELILGSTNIRKGNPDLESERSNLLSLTFSDFGRVLGGNVGIELFQSNNLISSIDYPLGNNIISTYANIGSKKSAALTGFLNWQIISNMNLSVNGRLEYAHFDAPSEGYKNAMWLGNFFANWNYTPKDIAQFGIYGGYSSKNPTLQGYYSGWYYYGVNISKALLADKSLTINLSANSFLQDTRSMKSMTTTHDTRTTSKYTMKCWNVGVSLQWNFGNIKERVKQTSANIINDDQSKANNGGQGGGLNSTH